MLWAMGAHRAFFRRRREVADPRALEDADIAAVETVSVAP